MASASSSAARLLIRDGRSAASLLFRGSTTNLTGTVQNSTGPAFRSLLRFNQTPAIQYPVFSETFPVMQSGSRLGGFIQRETFGKMKAGHGKGVVDNESGDSEETDFDEEDIDDDDSEEDDGDDDKFTDSIEDEDDDKEDKYTKKK